MGVISLFHRGSASGSDDHCSIEAVPVGVISLFHRGVPVGVISLFHRGSASGSDLTVPQRQCQWE